MKQTLFVIVGLLGVLLAACSGSQAAEPTAAVKQASGETTTLALPKPAALETVVDEQGAVTVAVTPLNIGGDAPTLDFEVAMNTHSVDLSMDLAALATLAADNGRSVTAVVWDAVPGGHHVTGMLSFPSDAAGATLIDGASQLTLTIREVDAAERTFSWSVAN